MLRTLGIAGVVSLLACSTGDDLPWRGRIRLGSPSQVRALLGGGPRAVARFMARAPREEMTAGRGQPFGLVSLFRYPSVGVQLGLTITEVGDRNRRVVYADQLDVSPNARQLVTVIRPPPGASWPRACQRYEMALSVPSGKLARGSFRVGGCRRAIEALRGRVIVHLGRKGPSLFRFGGSLEAYRKAIGSSRVIRAPAGSFYLGWKAAFAAPAGVSEVSVTLREQVTGNVLRKQTVRLDPSWDTLGGGWEVPAGGTWPLSGVHYELVVRRNAEPIARGRFRIVRRDESDRKLEPRPR